MSGMETCTRGDQLPAATTGGPLSWVISPLLPVWAEVCKKPTGRSLQAVGSSSQTKAELRTAGKWTNVPKASSGPSPRSPSLKSTRMVPVPTVRSLEASFSCFLYP